MYGVYGEIMQKRKATNGDKPNDDHPHGKETVSYTHLTLPTNREV